MATLTLVKRPPDVPNPEIMLTSGVRAKHDVLIAED